MVGLYMSICHDEKQDGLFALSSFQINDLYKK